MWPMTPRPINTVIIYFLFSLILFFSNQKIVSDFLIANVPIFWIQVAGMANCLLPVSHYRESGLWRVVSGCYQLPGPPALGQLPGSGGSETKMMAVMCNVSVTPALHCYITGHVSAVTRPGPHNGTLYTGRVPYVQPLLHPVSGGETQCYIQPGETVSREIHACWRFTSLN